MHKNNLSDDKPENYIKMINNLEDNEQNIYQDKKDKIENLIINDEKDEYIIGTNICSVSLCSY